MKIKDRKTAYDGYFKIYKLSVEEEGQTFTREQFSRGDAVAALVFDTAREEYILARQFRVGSESELIEVIAGMVDEGEEPDKSMEREIEEETGYKVDKLQHLYTFYPSPGGATEQITLYYAEVSEQLSSGGGNKHENEHIELIRVSVSELARLQTPDAKTIIAQQWAQLNKMDG